jgi:hypothetical protein
VEWVEGGKEEATRAFEEASQNPVRHNRKANPGRNYGIMLYRAKRRKTPEITVVAQSPEKTAYRHRRSFGTDSGMAESGAGGYSRRQEIVPSRVAGSSLASTAAS